MDKSPDMVAAAVDLLPVPQCKQDAFPLRITALLRDRTLPKKIRKFLMRVCIG